jgi:DNA polymerase-3 subunit gamma/tau
MSMAEDRYVLQQPAAQSNTLYRKYRPQSFAPGELVGQEAIAQTLRNAIAHGRVAHAYLFCGPRGTGKTSTARLLAKAVNCLHSDPWQRPCNACEACQLINTGATVDLIEIDAASNRGVDDIRDLREKVKYAPAQLRVKFYIIDEAHQLTRDACNAFLKTLEEPPPHVVFVLATTEPDKLLDTVASRCQRFDFRRIPLEAMCARLRTVCEREGIIADEQALELIARHASGSLRDALVLLERVRLFADTPDGTATLTAEHVRAALGLSRDERLAALVDALIARDAGAALRLINAVAEDGSDIQQFTRQLLDYLRLLLHTRAGGVELFADERARNQAAQLDLAGWTALLRVFSGLDLSFPRSGVEPLIVLELAAVEATLRLNGVTALPGVPAPSAAHRSSLPHEEAPPPPAPNRPAAAVPSVRSDRQPVPSARPSSPPARPMTPLPTASSSSDQHPRDEEALIERLVNDWQRIRREVRALSSKAAASLGDIEPVRLLGDELILVSPHEFHRNMVNRDAKVREAIVRVLERYIGRRVQIRCLSPEENRALSHATPSGASNVEPESPATATPAADLGDDDLERLRAARSIFNARDLPS